MIKNLTFDFGKVLVDYDFEPCMSSVALKDTWM